MCIPGNNYNLILENEEQESNLCFECINLYILVFNFKIKSILK